MTAKLWNCDGYWKPTLGNNKKQPFSNMIVCDGEWDGVEDTVDEHIFYYTDGDDVLNDHGDFVIECVSEYAPDWWAKKQDSRKDGIT